MLIKVIDFYPKPLNLKGTYMGTLHVYLPSKQLHLRGIKVFNTPLGLKIFTPQMKGYDEVKKKFVSFPIFDFDNKEEMQETIRQLLQYGREKVFEWMGKNQEALKQMENNRARKVSKFGAGKPRVAGLQKDSNRSVGRNSYHGKKPMDKRI